MVRNTLHRKRKIEYHDPTRDTGHNILIPISLIRSSVQNGKTYI
jgi:hypothetical protein